MKLCSPFEQLLRIENHYPPTICTSAISLNYVSLVSSSHRSFYFYSISILFPCCETKLNVQTITVPEPNNGICGLVFDHMENLQTDIKSKSSTKEE